MVAPHRSLLPLTESRYILSEQVQTHTTNEPNIPPTTTLSASPPTQHISTLNRTRVVTHLSRRQSSTNPSIPPSRPPTPNFAPQQPTSPAAFLCDKPRPPNMLRKQHPPSPRHPSHSIPFAHPTPPQHQRASSSLLQCPSLGHAHHIHLLLPLGRTQNRAH